MTNRNTDNTLPEPSDSMEAARDAALSQEADESTRPFAENAPIAGYISAILRKLGENAHSSVFLVRTIEGFPVTLKAYHDALPAENSDIIKKKISALRELPSHPRVARPLECVTDYDARQTYVISEYVAGDTLERALMEEGPFSQAQVLNWTCQLLEATNYLHRHGLCAPLKLSNIIRRRDDSVCIGDMGYVLMGGGDFAEARQEGFESNKPDSPKPAKPAFCATSVFGNPYTAERKREEIANDIYLTGAAAFQLFTGNPPRADASMEEHRRTLSYRGMSDSAADAILKALNPDPEARYQSDAEALSALRALPERDSRTRHMRLLRKAAFALLPFLMAVSLSAFLLGSRQAGHIREAETRRETARTALNEGRVSAALEAALQAADMESGPFDPPRSADTPRVLSDALRVYDYSEGYAPFRSVDNVGALLCISPDGTRCATSVVANDETPPSDESAVYMQSINLNVIDLESGQQVFSTKIPSQLQSQLQSESSHSITLPSDAYAFADNNTLLCFANKRLTAYGIDENRELWSEENVSALTLAGEFVAVVSGDGDGARVCRWTDRGLVEESRISFGNKRYFSSPRFLFDSGNASVSLSIEYPGLLSLREDGQYLAVSFPEGLLRVYRCDETGEYAQLLDDSEYTNANFVGGFCGDVFVYTAPSLCEAFRVDDDAPAHWERLARQENFQASLIRANKDGVYCALGNQILKFNAERAQWESIAEVTGSVQSLRYASGRIVAVTRVYADLSNTPSAPGAPGAPGDLVTSNDLVRVNMSVVILTPKASETGKADKPPASGAIEWNQTEIFTIQFLSYRASLPTLSVGTSGDFLILNHMRAEGSLSFWKWTDGAEKAESVLLYDGGYEHQFANITADGDAILYNRGPELFRIYPADGDGTSYTSVTADDWEDILNIQYLREPETPGEPSGESLRAEYAEHYDYYSVKDGQFLLRRGKAGETDVCVLTKDYRVTNTPDGGVEIRSRRTGKTLLTLPEGTLLDASQCRDTLLVSYQRANGGASGVLLNRRMETVAEIPGPCALLPDGRLYVDNQSGRLLQGRLYSPEELAEMARERLR